MSRPCPKCSRDTADPVPSSLDQCDATELPALKYVCPHCETVEWVPTGDPWRPTLWANLPPAKAGA